MITGILDFERSWTFRDLQDYWFPLWFIVMNIHDIKIKIFYHVVEIQILDELRKNEILSFLSWKSGCDLKNWILKDHAGKSPLKNIIYALIICYSRSTVIQPNCITPFILRKMYDSWAMSRSMWMISFERLF